MENIFDRSRLKRFAADPSSWTVLVIGAGKSGQAAARFLHQSGTRVKLSDSAPESEMDKEFASWLRAEGIEWEHGGHKPETFLGADLIIVSPGVPLDIPVLKKAEEKEIPVIGELGFASLFLDLPVIGVTGTNGKTTVTNMLAALFRAAGKEVFVGGNIGRPLSEYLLETTSMGNPPEREAELAVLEISSYQLETAGIFRPDVGVLLNISPDHLDRYDSYDAYAEAKFLLFANQLAGDKAVFNLDDPETCKRVSLSSGEGDRFYYSSRLKGGEGASWQDGEIVLFLEGSSEVYRVPEMLQSSPNRENAAAAVLAARLAGCPAEAIENGLASFVPPAHRVTLVAEIDGVSFYDDSKATNIGAVESALAGMDRPVILIAGGRDKGGDYNLLAPLIGEKVKLLLLIGEAREKMANVLIDAADLQLADSLQDAVSRAVEVAVPGDAVLLSPACASFDMYGSYTERGLHFQETVDGLLQLS